MVVCDVLFGLEHLVHHQLPLIHKEPFTESRVLAMTGLGTDNIISWNQQRTANISCSHFVFFKCLSSKVTL